MPPLRTYNNKSVKDIVNTKLVIFTMQGSVEIIDDLPVKISDSNTVNVRYMNTRKHMYMLFNYDNDMLCYDDKKKGIYRSVVVSYPEARVLSFAPLSHMCIFKKYIPNGGMKCMSMNTLRDV